MVRRTIAVVPFDPRWTERFESEHRAVAAALGTVVVALHHIGSTAVPGLAAKPVVDMLLEVRSLPELDQRAGRLEDLGYAAKGGYGIPGRRYFSKGEPERTHHLHAFASGDANLERHLAFRDYLRARPDIAAAYGRIEADASAVCDGDIESYMAAKSPFIAIHERAAVAWYRGAAR